MNVNCNELETKCAAAHSRARKTTAGLLRRVCVCNLYSRTASAPRPRCLRSQRPYTFVFWAHSGASIRRRIERHRLK